MLPILLNLNSVKFYTFGVFLLLAFFWGAFLLWKNFLLTSRKEEEIFDGLFISIAGGLVLGRLLYVILNFEDFGLNILKFILINGYPGISLYGFLIGAFISFCIYFKLRKIDINETLDYISPAAFLALGLGKLGSFLSGSEVGRRTDFILSLKYPGIEGSRHLTSLYEGIIFLVASFLSYKILFAIRRVKFPKGSNFFFFWWFFSLIYLIFDPLKTDKTLLFGFGFNFLLSSVLLLTFTLIFIYHFRSFIFEKLKVLQFNQRKNGKKIFKNIHKKQKRESS